MPRLVLNVEKSVLGRRWVARSEEAERVGLAISQRHGLPDLVGRVLAARGVPVEEAAAYLAPKLRELLPNPFSLRDMEPAADRLATAVRKGERVAVFGDYDVDGAASSALLHRWLSALGLTPPTLHIPDRIDEGYGPNIPAMEALAEAHDLLIAVDCGTLAFEPIAAAVAKGADVIVADHHLAAETVPACTAVVNPNRQDDESGAGHLCAAAVVFLLLVATQRKLRDADALPASAPDLMRYLDMVALATVADVAPLIGVNRALVRQGLHVMAQRCNPGLAALADVGRVQSPPAAFHLGFVLGPRVNAGGRVGQADLGARLLSTDDAAEAREIAEVLEIHNEQRRAIEAAVLEAAIDQVESRAGGPSAPLIWAAGEGWHPGVVGIVASRLKERYNRPAVVIGFDEAGEGKGSGRSIEGVDLGRSIAALAREGLLLKGGGHKMAAGLTVARETLEPALARLEALLEAQGAGEAGPRDLRIDGALAPSGASIELVEMLEAAGPFGQANPAPRFVIPSAKLSWVKPAGEHHLRFTAVDGAGGKLDAIAFRAFESDLGAFLQSRDKRPTHLAGRVEIDDWGGRRKAKLRVEDAAEV